MEIMGIGSVAAITVICYMVGMTVKQTKLDTLTDSLRPGSLEIPISRKEVF